jgi:gluconolactonase
MNVATRPWLVVSAIAFVLLRSSQAAAQAALDPPVGPPHAVIDLATTEGVRLVKGQWRYSDTRIIEVDFKAPGPDGQPTGAPIRTYDYTPHAGGADFDDSQWEVIDPPTLSNRRSTGRICFNWYRIGLTIPDRVGGFDPRGSTVVFETALDDYAITRRCGWTASCRVGSARSEAPW